MSKLSLEHCQEMVKLFRTCITPCVDGRSDGRLIHNYGKINENDFNKQKSTFKSYTFKQVKNQYKHLIIGMSQDELRILKAIKDIDITEWVIKRKMNQKSKLGKQTHSNPAHDLNLETQPDTAAPHFKSIEFNKKHGIYPKHPHIIKSNLKNKNDNNMDINDSILDDIKRAIEEELLDNPVLLELPDENNTQKRYYKRRKNKWKKKDKKDKKDKSEEEKKKKKDKKDVVPVFDYSLPNLTDDSPPRSNGYTTKLSRGDLVVCPVYCDKYDATRFTSI